MFQSCAACRFPDTVAVRENNFYCRFNDKTLQAYSAIMHFTGALASLPAGYVGPTFLIMMSCYHTLQTVANIAAEAIHYILLCNALQVTQHYGRTTSMRVAGSAYILGAILQVR